MTPEELRRRRQALGLTEVALARLLGVPYPTLWRWERGLTIRHGTLLALALEALEARKASSPPSP